MAHLQTEHHLSERRACRLVNFARSVYCYAAHQRDDSEIQAALAELAAKHPEFDFRKMFLTLRRLGCLWNHKRVYRVYCQLKLNLKRKHKRRIPTRDPLSLAVPFQANQVWSADFMSDGLWDGRRFRTFNVIDDFNREVLAVEIDTGISAVRVVRILDQIAVWRGLSALIVHLLSDTAFECYKRLPHRCRAVRLSWQVSLGDELNREFLPAFVHEPKTCRVIE